MDELDTEIEMLQKLIATNAYIIEQDMQKLQQYIQALHTDDDGKYIGHMPNSLGVIQSNGTLLNAYCTKLSTLTQIKNKMVGDEDGRTNTTTD